MDGAGSAGVVLISFGSTVNLQKVDPYYGNIFFQVIKKHKNVRFILKWNGPYPNGYENGLDNLLSDVWLPQRELLSKLIIILTIFTVRSAIFSKLCIFIRASQPQNFCDSWWFEFNSGSDVLWIANDCDASVCRYISGIIGNLTY